MTGYVTRADDLEYPPCMRLRKLTLQVEWNLVVRVSPNARSVYRDSLASGVDAARLTSM
jgi:hypothetical protein